MGLRINTNTPALNAQRQTQETSRQLLRGFERLSSGLRINRAADDAAGLAIAERFRADVRQFEQESRNLQSAINVTQTADGALGTQREGVQRLNELAIQASNGTLNDDQRAAINAEAQQIIEQIDETAANTEFNGAQLLDGSATNINVGTEGQNLEINVNESSAASLDIDTLDLSTQAGAQNAIDRIQTAAQGIDQNRANVGAQENRFQRAIAQRETATQNAQEAESRIRDLDVAQQVVEQTRNDILQQTGIAALSQANLQGQTAARLLGT